MESLFYKIFSSNAIQKERTFSNSIEGYSLEVSKQAQRLTELLREKHIASPSFSRDELSSIPAGPEYKEIQEARMALIDAASALQHLAIGPSDWIKWQALTVSRLFEQL